LLYEYVLSNATATTVSYSLSLHDALPIFAGFRTDEFHQFVGVAQFAAGQTGTAGQVATQRHDAVNAQFFIAGEQIAQISLAVAQDRKSTRLNSSHVKISYAVFCLKKQKKR